MTLDFFLIQLAVLFLPGVIWEHLDARFAAKEKPTQIEFLARSLIFGLVSHLVTYALFVGLRLPFEIVDFAKAGQQVVLTEQVLIQIGCATLIGFFLSLIWLRAVDKRWMPELLHALKVTSRYGDEDVWDFIFTSPGDASLFVNVREFDRELTYAGFVSSFSQNGQLRELALIEVDVYNFEGKLLFQTPQIYLSFKNDSAHIEFPLAAKRNGAPADA